MLKAGDLISHYRIAEVLGEGGMGVVYRAVDVRLNRTVALKVIGTTTDGTAASASSRKRAASAFNHPNIVTIHEVDAAGGTDFIVMELVPAVRWRSAWPAPDADRRRDRDCRADRRGHERGP